MRDNRYDNRSRRCADTDTGGIAFAHTGGFAFANSHSCDSPEQHSA